MYCTTVFLQISYECSYYQQVIRYYDYNSRKWFSFSHLAEVICIGNRALDAGELDQYNDSDRHREVISKGGTHEEKPEMT